MLGTDYMRFVEYLGIERPMQVMVYQRYGDFNAGDGTWIAQQLFWPGEDLAPYERSTVMGSLRDHQEFREDLLSLGFKKEEYLEVSDDFQAFLRGCLPIEWKSVLVEKVSDPHHLMARIQIYSR